jgi:hypothetical protein
MTGRRIRKRLSTEAGRKRQCNIKSKKLRKMKGGYTYKALSKSLSNASSEITGTSSSNSEQNNKKTRKRKVKYNTI